MSLAEQTSQLTDNFINSQSVENQAIIQEAFGTINAADFGSNALARVNGLKTLNYPMPGGGSVGRFIGFRHCGD